MFQLKFRVRAAGTWLASPSITVLMPNLGDFEMLKAVRLLSCAVRAQSIPASPVTRAADDWMDTIDVSDSESVAVQCQSDLILASVC